MAKRGILYVEDDADEALLTDYAFKEAAITHPIRVVPSGGRAINYLADTALGGKAGEDLLPCLILLDLHLPDISGLEVLKWIRSRPALASLVVILFTSSTNPLDVARAYRLGANSFVTKPSDINQRVELARLLKGWWLEHNRFAELDIVSSPPRAGVTANSPLWGEANPRIADF